MWHIEHNTRGKDLVRVVDSETGTVKIPWHDRATFYSVFDQAVFWHNTELSETVKKVGDKVVAYTRKAFGV